MPLDYSRWDHIDISDDEDDTHPNIDTPSLFRWRHQARLERMAENKQQQDEIESNKKQQEDKISILTKQLESTEISEDEKKKIELEIAEVKKQEAEWREKEKALEDKLRTEPWNIDTIGHEAFSSSRINKYAEKKAEPVKVDEEEDSKKMSDFFDKYESQLKAFGSISNIEATREYLLEHPHLANDYSASFITIEALNHAIVEEEEQLVNLSKQCIIIQYIIELAKSLKAKADHPNMIRAFFTKFEKADPSYMKLYQEEVLAFQDRLRKRAKVKRDEAFKQEEEENKSERIRESPGGLDPYEVFESLPVEMRDAFESRDISRLQNLATSMDKEVFAYHLDRCIKSGLWVPGGEDKESDKENDEASEDFENPPPARSRDANEEVPDGSELSSP